MGSRSGTVDVEWVSGSSLNDPLVARAISALSSFSGPFRVIYPMSGIGIFSSVRFLQLLSTCATKIMIRLFFRIRFASACLSIKIFQSPDEIIFDWWPSPSLYSKRRNTPILISHSAISIYRASERCKPPLTVTRSISKFALWWNCI